MSGASVTRLPHRSRDGRIRSSCLRRNLVVDFRENRVHHFDPNTLLNVEGGGLLNAFRQTPRRIAPSTYSVDYLTPLLQWNDRLQPKVGCHSSVTATIPTNDVKHGTVAGAFVLARRRMRLYPTRREADRRVLSKLLCFNLRIAVRSRRTLRATVCIMLCRRSQRARARS